MLGHSSEGTWVMIRVRHLDRRQLCWEEGSVCDRKRGDNLFLF